MCNVKTVSSELEITIDEILEILDISLEDAADMHPDEIIEALIDNGLFVYGDDDWSPGCDSVSNFIDA